MPKFRAEILEERTYPTLGMVIKPDEVVNLPAGTSIAGLVLVEEKAQKKSDPVAEATISEGA